jgi:hypothetical protein
MSENQDLHPDLYGYSIDYEVMKTGLNNNDGEYPEDSYIKCKKCGFTFNKSRHSKGWGEGKAQPYTQLNGAVTLAATTITVDSTTGFATPATGTITAFTKNGNSTKVTDAAHGLKGGIVIISSTTNYDGTFHIQDVTTDTFVIQKAYVADDATGTWIVPEYIEIYDVGTYSSWSTYEDVSQTYTAATGGPRCDRVQYTGLTSTTFTGTTGVKAHDDDMYVRGERKGDGCPFCHSYNYD